MAIWISSREHLPLFGEIQVAPNPDRDVGYLVERVEFGGFPTHGAFRINDEVCDARDLDPLGVSAFALRVSDVDTTAIAEIVQRSEPLVRGRLRDTCLSLGALGTSDLDIAHATAVAFDAGLFEATTSLRARRRHPLDQYASLEEIMALRLKERGWDFKTYLGYISEGDATHPIEQRVKQQKNWLKDKVFASSRAELVLYWQLESRLSNAAVK